MQKIKNNPLKIAFFGTPELTTVLLDSLQKNNLTPSLIVTNKDMPKGRKLVLTSPPAKIWALKHNISCLQPERIDMDFIEKLKKENFDLFVVVAYGKILPEALIDLPTHGTINVHYSLLPKYRGATPVESAILNGDTETGVCIQKMAFKLDTGAILASEKISLSKDITAPTLRNVLNEKAAEILSNIIRKYIAGEITPTPQNEHEATNCHKIKKEDGLIDVHGDPVVNDRKFRAYFAWPRTYFFACLRRQASQKNDPAKKIRITVSEAHMQNNAFVITKVIPEGKKEMTFEQCANNYVF